MIIDAHLHLWKKQSGRVNGKPVRGLGGGKSDFGGEVRQMLPPYMFNDENNIEMLLSNMDYAGVGACVVTQEYIDGNQDAYLLEVKARFPDRVKICSLYEEKEAFALEGFDGVKICAGRLANPDLAALSNVFKKIESQGKFLSIDLAEGDTQVGQMEALIAQCPDLKIAIGHFGMAGRTGWQEQIKLARHKNVFIESGGITWLYNDEFYPYPSAVKAIRESITLCGAEKLMWGSDYPRTMTAITYKMSLDFVEKTSELTGEEKALFLGGNAQSFYGFKALPELKAIPNMVE